jgi:hypothetical protein
MFQLQETRHAAGLMHNINAGRQSPHPVAHQGRSREVAWALTVRLEACGYARR